MDGKTDQIDSPRRALNSEGVTRDVIVIGASAGGVEALGRLFSLLPRELPATIACVLQRGIIPSRLAEVLTRHSSMPIREPQRDETVHRGVIYLALPISISCLRRTASWCNAGPESTVRGPPSIRYFA
jgi:two-component system chemotaxis response regulator CheB